MSTQKPSGGVVLDDGRVVPTAELEERFSLHRGQGGQRANRVRSRVELRIDVSSATLFSDDERARLVEQFGQWAAVVVDDTRSQARNRVIARERLAEKLRRALAQPASRNSGAAATGRAATERRLDAKRRRSRIKEARQPPDRDC